MMMLRSLLLSLLAVLLISPTVALFDCLKCPTDDSLDPKCLINIIPPWPICLFHDTKYFLAKAVDGASRCCGDDTSKCRCPKQDTDKYKKSIGDWCAGIAKCPQSAVKEDEIDKVKNAQGEVEEALQ
jgi:hypothetical protein